MNNAQSHIGKLLTAIKAIPWIVIETTYQHWLNPDYHKYKNMADTPMLRYDEYKTNHMLKISPIKVLQLDKMIDPFLNMTSNKVAPPFKFQVLFSSQVMHKKMHHSWHKIAPFLSYTWAALLLIQFGAPNRSITYSSKSDLHANFDFQKQQHSTIFMNKLLLFFVLC